MNISPENISQTETKFCVDINFAKGEPKFVYFKDCEPVLAKLVKNLLSLKSQYKKQGLKSLEKAVKLCVNTIYGLTN
jgi:DNA polymerase elongation subunit (family B)